jgi:D-isomer specific 2-hydroxyacid dehydrogenase, NAD binding domain
LHPGTLDLFNNELIAKMKRGAYLVNTARGIICNRDAVFVYLRAGSLPDMQATSGPRSLHPKTTHGERCLMTA